MVWTERAAALAHLVTFAFILDFDLNAHIYVNSIEPDENDNVVRRFLKASLKLVPVCVCVCARVCVRAC